MDLVLESNRMKQYGSYNNTELPCTVANVDDEHRQDVENKEKDKLLSISDAEVKTCQNKSLLVKTILCGQVLSFMQCGTGTSATTLQVIYGIHTPAFNAFTMYTLLAATFGIYAIRSNGFVPLMKKQWLKYLFVVFLDVEANYFLTKAYSYATLTSVQLCDCVTIPTVMIVSCLFLRVRYKCIHIGGVLICISGAVSLVLVDRFDEEQNAPNEYLGDGIAVAAAVLYGISQVGQEYLVKEYPWKTYMGMVGLYGFVISGIQTVVLERQIIHHIGWNWKIGLTMLGFAFAQYHYYVFMPLVMRLSSATVVNLSLLTSDLYTLLVGIFLFKYKFSYFYIIPFCLIMAGLITYNLRPEPDAPLKSNEQQETNIESELSVSFVKDEDRVTTPIPRKKRNCNSYSQLIA